jgi:hypothetical protein
MLDAAQGADLSGEARLRLRVAGAQEALERDLPAQRLLPGAVDDAHAAAADPRQEVEAADPALDGGRGLLARRGLLRLAPELPLHHRLALDRRAEDVREERRDVVARAVALEDAPRGIREELGPPLAAPCAQEEHFPGVRVVDEERVEGTESAGRREQVQLAGVRQRRRLGARQLHRLEAARALALELAAADEPPPGLFAAHLIDEDEPPAGEHIEASEHLGGAEEERAAHPVVVLARALARRAVAQLAIAVLDQPVEHLREPDRRLTSLRRIAADGLPEGEIEPRRPRQVIAHAAEHEVAHHEETAVARLGEDRHDPPDDLPPVAQGGTREALQSLGEEGVLRLELSVLDDGGGGQQLERRLPEVVGRLVALERGLGVVRPPVELREGQRQTPEEVLVAG